MLLEHGELGLDAPGLADVRRLREAVVGAEEVAARAQAGKALAAGRGIGRLGLQPVDRAEAELARGVEMLLRSSGETPQSTPEWYSLVGQIATVTSLGNAPGSKLSRQSMRRKFQVLAM